MFLTKYYNQFSGQDFDYQTYWGQFLRSFERDCKRQNLPAFVKRTKGEFKRFLDMAVNDDERFERRVNALQKLRAVEHLSSALRVRKRRKNPVQTEYGAKSPPSVAPDKEDLLFVALQTLELGCFCDAITTAMDRVATRLDIKEIDKPVYGREEDFHLLDIMALAHTDIGKFLRLTECKDSFKICSLRTSIAFENPDRRTRQNL